ncbi:MAG: hypothetical protein RI907_894 [Pseudomonadota bacterium]|jgi:hydrogenase maturation protease
MNRLVVFGWGNPSRGDDALGPGLLAEVAKANLPGVATVEDFQLQIEHTLDMVDAGLLLFIDAGMGTPAPWTFQEIVAQPPGRLNTSSHALSPQALLRVFEQVQGRPAPPAFLLCVRGEGFDLGAGLSEAGRLHAASAQRWLGRLLAQPDLDVWRQLCPDGRGAGATRLGFPQSSGMLAGKLHR